MKKNVKKLCVAGMAVSAAFIALLYILRLITAQEINWYSPTMLLPRITQKSCFVALLAFLFYMQLDKLKETAVFGYIKKYTVAQKLICLITLSLAEAEIVRSAIKTPTQNGALGFIVVLGLICFCIAVSLENFKLREINIFSLKPMLFIIICTLIALICAAATVSVWLGFNGFSL